MSGPGGVIPLYDVPGNIQPFIGSHFEQDPDFWVKLREGPRFLWSDLERILNL